MKKSKFNLLNKHILRYLLLFTLGVILFFVNQIDSVNEKRITVINFFYMVGLVTFLIRYLVFYIKQIMDIKHKGYSCAAKTNSNEEYINYLSNYDHLTKLPNKNMFVKKLNELIKCNKEGGVILIDIDDFRKINDTFSHEYGDKVLKELSKDLMNHMEHEDVFVSRFAGDEFWLITEQEDLKKCIKNLYTIINKKRIVDNHSINIDCSMGIALFPRDTTDINQLIKYAELAMHQAKKTQKNTYLFYRKNMVEVLERNNKIESILKEAMDNNGFKLLYQPQVSIKNSQVIGLEALIRLKNYNISPEQFILVAEEMHIIHKIGRWVTKEVILQLDQWRKSDEELKPIGINFSVKQMEDKEYISFLKDLLLQYDIDPKYIDIEITENELIKNEEYAIEYLNQLKEVGVTISLDDFGKGYSSLHYLTFLPINKIKLDKSLYQKDASKYNYIIMENIIALAHDLSLEVVAEGVETKSQYNKLQELKCDYVQGFLFSKPIEAKAVKALKRITIV
ncbi:diguanylate cyclase (GGDEF)-like protein [Natranaerovirga hydrolytica]|uniref:Diguanylate cyclase (GGDEF)-like protein n=1 Tax=Natranaerovirga hydrolytica TaxID=680378 RepID=A0A4R1MK71_9FIRM|nr:bifunctional diguanylate cyclase/phosphodiesterase [Natranaerovirga hydrolytica]TCK92420.1 diguanylate cyclase (GGDEF)-like protein [Natranaerovirga hydrolytica]